MKKLRAAAAAVILHEQMVDSGRVRAWGERPGRSSHARECGKPPVGLGCPHFGEVDCGLIADGR